MTGLRSIIAAVCFLSLLASSSRAQERPVVVALIGDSTVTDAAGWGKAFAGRFNDRVKVLNFSVGGRSSKSWYDEKRLPKALEAKPEYVLIQFGHNGQPGKGPARETDPATTYRDYLKIYINAFREIGATPILVSSVTRRGFGEDGKIRSSLEPWAKAAGEVAAEMKTPFLDLHSASVAYHNRIGPKESMTLNAKEGDRTHFNEKGAEAITDLIVAELAKTCPHLARYLKSTGSDKGQ